MVVSYVAGFCLDGENVVSTDYSLVKVREGHI